MIEVLYSKYMTLRRCRALGRTGLVLSGPGHDVAILAALALDERGRPRLLFKAGDTRPPRTLRGEPYVKTGLVGGRLDHRGVDPAATAALELAEETGGELADGTLAELGSRSPTMPNVSTEEDRYFVAAVRFDPAARPRSDGGGMELSGLMHPVLISVEDALAAIDAGRVGEGARARVGFARALSVIGWVPGPGGRFRALTEDERSLFDTLGSGSLLDTKGWPAGVTPPRYTASDASARVDSWASLSEQRIELEDGMVMIEAVAAHTISGSPPTRVGEPYTIQFLHLPFDVVKIVRWAPDHVHGACVALGESESLPLFVKGESFSAEVPSGAEAVRARPDIDELSIRVSPQADQTRARLDSALADFALDHKAIAAPVLLGAAADASPGQSDLRYHFAAVQTPMRPGLVPIREALRACREKRGDAATECALLRLAHKLSYVPELGHFAR